MRLLDLPQAKHFCNPSTTALASVGSQSLVAFHIARPHRSALIEEGTGRFEIHQVNLLDCVERWLLYALGNYRRAMDMLVPLSAPWAHVSLYYSSFFAANAILGMFGGWIGHTKDGNRVVDVERGAAGNQALRLHRRLASPGGGGGSHKTFWDFFYDATPMIAAWAPAELADALTPVAGDVAWQIIERNNVNYDMFHAWATSTAFHSTFRSSKLASLSGALRLQLEATEQILCLALSFARTLSLATGALAGCGAMGNRNQIQRRLVTQAVPRIVSQSQLANLLEA